MMHDHFKVYSVNEDGQLHERIIIAMHKGDAVSTHRDHYPDEAVMSIYRLGVRP